MTKTIVVLIMMSLFFNVNAQNQDDNSYYPLTLGMSKTLTWYNGKYREIIKDTIALNGKTYTKISQIFPPKKEINIYLRKSNDTIYFFNEKSKTEKPFFGISPNKGEIIGNGTIKKINAKLNTPKGKLTELLVVEMKYSNGNKDLRYYKRGLGLVAVKNKKGLICYYVPD